MRWGVINVVFKNRFLKKMVAPILSVVLLTLLVLWVNRPAIEFDMMYPEQPIIFLANQQISSFSDLINVYLHPKMLHFMIPFFRPSGHFLMYQLLIPILGWHNFKALIVVNLILLALSGFLIIKIYDLMFPNLKMGGYIAFAIYLMHPALILSRFISLHFEFGYVFFLLLGMYSFILFCERNRLLERECLQGAEKIELKKLGYLVMSILFFVIAASFKEPAIMLGPVLCTFLLTALYGRLGVGGLFSAVIRNKEIRNVLLLIGLVSLMLLFYITLAWPTFSSPVKPIFHLSDILFSLQGFFYSTFNFKVTSISGINNIINGFDMWKSEAFPLVTKLTLWVVLGLTFAAFISLYKKNNPLLKFYKRSLIFFFLASCIFLILPLGWGMAHPWHYSLTILMLSFMMGFSCDYLVLQMMHVKKWHHIVCMSIAMLIGMQCILTDQSAINTFTGTERDRLTFKLLQKSILYPPKIQNQLTKNSMLVIEDAVIENAYITGGGGNYPFLRLEKLGYRYAFMYSKMYNAAVLPDPDYSGTLFRWAYLNSHLLEMTYPFSVNKMSQVENEMIYLWLRHYNDIFCLGYDRNGNWFDRTDQFKKNLLNEKQKRKIQVGSYKVLSVVSLKGDITSSILIPYPDQQVCQYQCDLDGKCHGFTYKHLSAAGRYVTRCDFYNKLEKTVDACPMCASYVKV